MAKKLRKSTECLNCHELIHDSNYCPNCGQINTDKQVHLKHFFIDFISDYFTFDSKFTRSFIPLFGKPGFLTNEYNQGKRTSYILPLRLYFFTTIMFFIILSINNKISGSNSLDGQPQELTALELDSLFSLEETVSLETKYKIISELNRSYKVTKNNDKKTTVPDSIRIYIMLFQSDISAKTAEFIAENVYNRFLFYTKKSKKTEESVNKAFLEFLNGYKILQTSVADSVLERLNTNYRLKIRKSYDTSEKVLNGDTLLVYYPKPSGAKIVIGNAPADSLEDGVIKSFLKKAERVSKYGSGSSFWQEVVNQIPKVMFVVLPLFALILKFLYVRKGIFYINHLIFSLHAHTLFFIYLLFPLLYTHWTTVVFCVFGIITHLFLSLKNVYKQSAVKTFLKLCLLLAIYIIPITFGFILLTILAVINI